MEAMKAKALIKIIAGMTMSGEKVDRRKFVMSPDDAIDTVNRLIREARSVVESESESASQPALSAEEVEMLKGLISDALELKDMKQEINNDYTPEDLDTWDENLRKKEGLINRLTTAAEKAIIPTVVIRLDGGLVQTVESDYPSLIPPLKLMVLDFDIEGADREDLLQVPQLGTNDSEEAAGRYETIEKTSIDIPSVLKQLNERGW